MLGVFAFIGSAQHLADFNKLVSYHPPAFQSFPLVDDLSLNVGFPVLAARFWNPLRCDFRYRAFSGLYGLKDRGGGERIVIDILAEWLRRETRNLMGFPAQVQILQMS